MTVLRREVTLSYLANPEGVFLSHSCVACPPYRAYLRPSTSNPSKSKSVVLDIWNQALALVVWRRAAQTNPVSSRATAVTAFGAGMPFSVIRR